MLCSQIMRNPILVGADTPLTEAARLMRDQVTGILPVCDSDGRPIGVITDRDIVIRAFAEGRERADLRVGELMSRELVSCRTTDPLQRAEELMTKHQKYRVLVVDEAGRLQGIISLTDVAHSEQPLRLATLVERTSARELRVKCK